MATIQSGAFAQQCFSAHPLSLNVKALVRPDRVVLTCANCHMRHRLTVRTLTTRAAEAGGPEREATGDLEGCVAEHPGELRISAVDVLTDSVKLRCGACRKGYTLTVAVFETYRKEG